MSPPVSSLIVGASCLHDPTPYSILRTCWVHHFERRRVRSDERRQGRSPFPPPDMTTTATGLLCWTGLSPAGMAASLAALELRSQASDVLSFSREARLLAPSNAEAQKSRKL